MTGYVHVELCVGKDFTIRSDTGQIFFALPIRDHVTRRAEPMQNAVDVYSRKRMVELEADDECSSVSLDLSCGSSSFNDEDCGIEAEEVIDLVLPRIFRVRPVSPYTFQPLAALHSTPELAAVEPAVSQENDYQKLRWSLFSHQSKYCKCHCF